MGEHSLLVVQIVGKQPLEGDLFFASEHAAEALAFFAEDDLVPALRSYQRSLHNGNAATCYEDGFFDGWRQLMPTVLFKSYFGVHGADILSFWS